MTEQEKVLLKSLRDQGYAVVTFTPDEIGSTPKEEVERRLVEMGNEIIENYQEPGEEENA